MLGRLWVLAPCYFDTRCFAKLKTAIDATVSEHFPGTIVNAVLVDDSGGQDATVAEFADRPGVMTIVAPYNLGHQGAIVYGLRTLSPLIADEDYVITLDSDGEDQPEDIPALLAPLYGAGNNKALVSLAQRTRRHESLAFKVLYGAFKMLFQLLTGTIVRTGNFAACRGWFVRNVLFHPFFDYCYSSSYLALSLNRKMVPLPRGRRYFGKSKMTLVTLVTHGFRMLLPFSETIAIRTVVLSAVLFCVGIAVAMGALTMVAAHTEGSFVALFGALALCLLSIVVAVTSCLFFNIVNQTKALSLRTLSAGAADDPRQRSTSTLERT
ncbi:MAG: glycosyltransferase, partial [Terriglobales bacterium]